MCDWFIVRDVVNLAGFPSPKSGDNRAHNVVAMDHIDDAFALPNLFVDVGQVTFFGQFRMPSLEIKRRHLNDSEWITQLMGHGGSGQGLAGVVANDAGRYGVVERGASVMTCGRTGRTI